MPEIVIQAVGSRDGGGAASSAGSSSPGTTVAVDEPVAEIETDKATMDVVSPVRRDARAAPGRGR